MFDKFRSIGFFSALNIDSHCKINLTGFSQSTGKPLEEILIPNKDGSVDLKLIHEIGSNLYRLRGNLRKWYFGKYRPFMDLNFADFVNALKFIAHRLGVDENELWEFKITLAELGGNIKLKRAYSGFISCLLHYPRLTKMNYEKGSVYFLGTKYWIKIYDKTEESFKKLAKDEKFKKKEYLLKKITKSIYCVRIEKTIKNKSGTSLKKEIDSFRSVKENWDFLVDDWLGILHKIEKVDKFSSLSRFLKGNLTGKRLTLILASLKLEDIGEDIVLDFIDDNAEVRKKECRERLYEIHDNLRTGDKKYYMADILSKTALKAEKMKRRKPQLFN